MDVATTVLVRTVAAPFTIGGGAINDVELKVLAQSAHSTVDVYDLNVQPG